MEVTLSCVDVDGDLLKTVYISNNTFKKLTEIMKHEDAVHEYIVLEKIINEYCKKIRNK